MSKQLASTQSSNTLCIEDISEMSNILDNLLFLGSQSSTRSDLIVKCNIQTIISIGCNPIDKAVKNYKYDVEDNYDVNNLYNFFNNIMPIAHDIINQCLNKKKAVLVHCQAGISRSTSIIITWLMIYKNMTYDEAFLYVKERRHIISPNVKFVDYMKNITT